MKKLLLGLMLISNMVYSQLFVNSYAFEENNFTELINLMPFDVNIGNPCGQPFFITGWYDGDLEMTYRIRLYHAKLIVYGNPIDVKIDLMCEQSEVIYDTTLDIISTEGGVEVIYPNPVVDNLNIKLLRGKNLEVYNLAGQKVISASLLAGLNTVDFSNQAPGFYIVKIDNFVTKVIKAQ